MGEKNCFDEGWRFSPIDSQDARKLQFDDSCWQQVTVPHDWTVKAVYEKQAASGERAVLPEEEPAGPSGGQTDAGEGGISHVRRHFYE